MAEAKNLMGQVDKMRLDKAKMGLFVNADQPLSNGQDLMDAYTNGYKLQKKPKSDDEKEEEDDKKDKPDDKPKPEWVFPDDGVMNSCRTCNMAWMKDEEASCKCVPMPPLDFREMCKNAEPTVLR